MLSDLQMRGLRTDLVIEAKNMVTAGVPEGFPGVEMDQASFALGRISRVRVLDQEGAEKLGKPIGHYTTFEVPDMKLYDEEQKEELSKRLAIEMLNLIKSKVSGDAMVLVVGLGNAAVTPDALGSKVIDRLLVTRHLVDLVPDKLRVPVRPIAALKPGVLGNTGIETFDIIAGVVEQVQPQLLIVIDSLAARTLERLNTTIQLSDTGIQPGAGVGNHRRALDERSLGIPVVALGIPTVVDATTIVSDTLDQLLQQLIAEGGVEGKVEGWYEQADQLHHHLKPLTGKMMVTSHEIDLQIDCMAEILAAGLDKALNPLI